MPETREDSAPAFPSTPLPPAILEQSGIRVESMENGGTRFRFPRGCTIARATALSVYAIASVATLLLGLAFLSPDWSVTFAKLLVPGLLYFVADLYFYSGRVEVTPDSLKVVGGIFGIAWPRNFTNANLVRFESGIKGTGELIAVHADGRKFVIAKRIQPDSLVEEFIRRINAIQGRATLTTVVANEGAVG